jgi:hypothetical protein
MNDSNPQSLPAEPPRLARNKSKLTAWSCVDGALRSSTIWRGDDCGRVQSCVWPVGAAILTAAGPDVVREAGPDQMLGLDTRDHTEGSPTSTTDRSTSCHQHLPQTRDALRRVPRTLALQSYAAVAAITHCQASYPVAAHASAR